MEIQAKDIDVTLFEPKGKDLRVQYPELKDHPEFDELTSSDLKFVWYVSNRTSPLVQEYPKDQFQRIDAAVQLCYSQITTRNQKKIGDFKAGKFPEGIAQAIKVMHRFDPSVRLVAKFMAEFMFRQLQRMVFVKDDELVDVEDKNKYIATIKNATTQLPELVKQVEHGFGIDIKLKRTGEKVQIGLADLEND